MEENVGWVIIIIAILVLLIVGIRFLPGGLYYALAVLGFVVHYSLDQLFSAGFFPTMPWIMWVIWGGIIGAAFAFWTIAPIYGLRNQRRQIMFAPLALMLVVMLIRLIIGK